ncbi:hypothetical protein [Cellulomonas sp. P5_C6]
MDDWLSLIVVTVGWAVAGLAVMSLVRPGSLSSELNRSASAVHGYRVRGAAVLAGLCLVVVGRGLGSPSSRGLVVGLLLLGALVHLATYPARELAVAQDDVDGRHEALDRVDRSAVVHLAATFGAGLVCAGVALVLG